MTSLRILFFAVLTSLLVSSCSKKSATCSDGIQNQGETRVDCGGPCTPCGTCSDGVQNQDETNVDCGGMCSKCATCTDGIQNQGETGIDCGGPCNLCPIVYPANDTYGPNILRTDTSIVATNTNHNGYSMSAQLPSGTSLRVVMSYTMTGTQTSSFPVGWAYDLGSKSGWTIGGYNQTANTQEFSASGQGNCVVEIIFENHGIGRIDFYENGATMPARVKYLSW